MSFIYTDSAGVIEKETTTTLTVADTGYNIVATDECILVDTSGGDTTVNLPTAVGAGSTTFTIKKIDAANTLTIGSAGGTIDGADSLDVIVNMESVKVVSDNADWWII